MTELPEIKPLMLEVTVAGLPTMELRSLTRDEMSHVVSPSFSSDDQDKIMTDILGGTPEAAEWYGKLPHATAMKLMGELIRQSSERALAHEVAQAGESSRGGATSGSDSSSPENSG